MALCGIGEALAEASGATMPRQHSAAAVAITRRSLFMACSLLGVRLTVKVRDCSSQDKWYAVAILTPMSGTSVGERVRALRHRRGLSQAALAGGDVSESYISLVESGRRSPSEATLALLADRLGVSVGVLTGRESLRDGDDAELLARRGEWEVSSGRPGAAEMHFAEAIGLACELNLGVLEMRARVGLARALEAQGRLEEAVGAWQAVREGGRRTPRVSREHDALVGLMRCQRELGNLNRAVELGEEYWRKVDLRAARESGTLEEVVVVGATLLAAYLELCEERRCHELAEQLVALADEAQTPTAQGAAYWNAALAAEANGRVAEALAFAERAQGCMAETQDVRNRARLQVVLGGLRLRLRPPEAVEALRLLRAAEPVLAQFAGALDVAYCETEVARAHLYLGACGEARTIAEGALARLADHGESRIEAARALLVLAGAQAALGERESALSSARSAAELLESLGAARQAASTWTELAELAVQLEDAPGAISAYRRATELLGVHRSAPVTTQATSLPEQRVG
jgi:transcriptional regulator with XRE-family HTH domain/tetratricopeptide (TPR) repeat protein